MTVNKTAESAQMVLHECLGVDFGCIYLAPLTKKSSHLCSRYII